MRGTHISALVSGSWCEPISKRAKRVVAQFVHLRHSMDTTDRAERRAGLLAVILPFEIVSPVLCEGNAWTSALL